MKILIMAGGSGERFWPLSTKELPKQLLPLLSNKSMIRETIERLIGFVESLDIYIATNEIQYKNIMKELPEIPKENIIVEPAFRDTAAAILYSTTYISQKNNYHNVIAVLASDHSITNNQEFIKSLTIAKELANSENKIVTFGIKPSYPEIGYGYIKVDSARINSPVFNVKFIEKPDIYNAKKYQESGNYLWNSGIFIFKYDTLLKKFNDFSIEHINVLNKLKDKLLKFDSIFLTNEIRKYFELFPKISIDYAVMEKSNDLICLPVDFGWSDVGTFDTLSKVLPSDNYGNTSRNSSIIETINSTNNLIISDDYFDISLIDVEGIILIIKGNKMLITKKGSSSKIKSLKNT